MIKSNTNPSLVDEIQEIFPEAVNVTVHTMDEFFSTFSDCGVEIPVGVEPDKNREHFTCTCCGRRFYGMGNNPLPLTRETWGVEDGPRACNECDRKYVLRARFYLDREGVDWRNLKIKSYQRKRFKRAFMRAVDADLATE